MEYNNADVAVLSESLKQLMSLYQNQTELYLESQQLLVAQKLKKPVLTLYSGETISIEPVNTAGKDKELKKKLSRLKSHLKQLNDQYQASNDQKNRVNDQLLDENRELRREIAKLKKTRNQNSDI